MFTFHNVARNFGFVNEKWIICKTVPLTLTNLGVGPLWWHSKKDMKIMKRKLPDESNENPPNKRRRRTGK